MIDIVERLRNRQVCSDAHNSCRNDWRCEEAADEIERLRLELNEQIASAAQLRELIKKYLTAAGAARKALGETNE